MEQMWDKFLAQEITVIRAGFEPRTSRSLSQRPTIRILLPQISHKLGNHKDSAVHAHFGGHAFLVTLAVHIVSTSLRL
ncbi:hypothetical protein DPMN_013262 [Dreissena polymorpha]|uniref:Uncharacterized protein n=1 Tax=Dreissena polymorpha TaxID=45954 RepID=A0A9D4N7G9_DREPO|nr:hypothetical protein DPMN_013262 [Dreissena polymorpha]